MKFVFCFMKIGSRLILAEDKAKKVFRPITLKLILPVGEAKNNAVLGPLLGQHQLNIVSFCNEFNAKSQTHFEVGVPLRVFVILQKDKTYKIFYNPPSLNFFIFQMQNENGSVDIESLYDILLMYSFFFKKRDLHSLAREVLGYLSSYNKKSRIFLNI